LKQSTSQLLNFERDSYLERTSRPFYAIMFLLPFIVFYELGTIIINTDVLSQSQVRVVTFVWLQELLGYLGFSGKLAWMAPPLVVILILLGLQLASRTKWYFSMGDIGPMLVECTLLAIPLIVLSLFVNSPHTPIGEDVNQLAVIHDAHRLTTDQGGGLLSCSAAPANQVDSQPQTSAWLANIITGIGAGIYEELVFRLILICLLMLVFQDLIGIDHGVAVILSILISAGLFSAHHHYVFIDGELTQSAQFSWIAFVFRAAAGVYFAGLFAVRGFGITAGTHAFYDIIATILNAMFFHQST
jgi:membrane protease YdiL (CAAX protease family)